MAAIAIDLDITQGTEIADTTCHVKGMEHSGESTEGIGAGGLDLTHDIHHDGACLSDIDIEATALIASA